jgi:LacI family transcriptional regulator
MHALEDVEGAQGDDDVEGGDLAVSHLLELGHERIAFVGGPGSIVQLRDRLTGARRALEAAGRSADALLEIPTEGLTVAEGRRAGQRLTGLPSKRRPTAAFCANDLLALGLLQQLTEYGLAVPDDLAIVGYDDIEFAAAAAVPPRPAPQHRAHEHRRIEFKPELVVRRSRRGATRSARPEV